MSDETQQGLLTTSESIEIDTGSGVMPAVYRGPAAGRGLIVVVHEGFGVTAHTESIAERLAQSGWATISIDLFHRQGSPVVPYTDVPKAIALAQELEADLVLSDVRAAVTTATERGWSPKQCGVLGFCLGGAVALFAACRLSLGAAVTFYGDGIIESRFGLPPLVDEVAHLDAPWLGLYGGRDKYIPITDVERLRAQVESRTPEAKIVVYGGAGHGFMNDRRPEIFDDAAAVDAWREALAWLSVHIGADEADGLTSHG